MDIDKKTSSLAQRLATLLLDDNTIPSTDVRLATQAGALRPTHGRGAELRQAGRVSSAAQLRSQFFAMFAHSASEP